MGKLFHTAIYRYTSIRHLRDMIVSSENVLVNPYCWEDSYESAATRVPSTWINGSSVDVSQMGDELFAQCWCADPKESDLRWKAYKSDDGTVRIATSVEKLLVSVGDLFPVRSAMVCASLFGRVCYCSQNVIEKTLGGVPLLRFPEAVMPLLFIRREEYRQEEELRLVIRNCETAGMDEFRDRVKIKGHLMRMPLVDGAYFIDEILLGTNVSEKNEQLLRAELDKAGWNAKVFRSKLNQIPSFRTKY